MKTYLDIGLKKTRQVICAAMPKSRRAIARGKLINLFMGETGYKVVYQGLKGCNDKKPWPKNQSYIYVSLTFGIKIWHVKLVVTHRSSNVSKWIHIVNPFF